MAPNLLDADAHQCRLAGRRLIAHPDSDSVFEKRPAGTARMNAVRNPHEHQEDEVRDERLRRHKSVNHIENTGVAA
jgi:hypothetical protein